MSDKIKPFGQVEANTKPAAIENWKVGAEITRANFASFVWQTFMFSRGRPETQALLVRDLKNFGFLSKTPFLRDAISALTEEEIKLIYKRYQSARTNDHKNVDYRVFRNGVENILHKVETLSTETIWPSIIFSLIAKNPRKALLNVLRIRAKLKRSVKALPIN